MDKIKKSQIFKLLIIIILLCITPLLSESFRQPYLYFVVNLLIIALGAEAGLLSFLLKVAEDKKATSAQKPLISSQEAQIPNPVINYAVIQEEPIKKMPKAVEKSHSEKIISASKVNNKVVKRCPSTPSLFFIGGVGETTELAEEFIIDQEDDDDDDIIGEEEEEFVGEITGQELFLKAETFIGNFYKQLKMQREESWKKINGLYHKAF